MLLARDEHQPEDSDFEYLIDSNQVNQVQEQLYSLSLNAMQSTTSAGIMRFMGALKGELVHILLNDGSEDNFMQLRLSKFLHLDIFLVPPFRVLVGSGHTLQVEDRVKNQVIIVQDHHSLHFNAYLLQVKGVKIILGSSWLVALGPHIAYYTRRMIQFYHQGNFVKL